MSLPAQARKRDIRRTSEPKMKSKRAVEKRPRVPLRIIAAMKATLREEPPTEGDWSYELKFDGFRALALKDGDSVELFSLNGKDFKGRFPEIAEAIAELPDEQLALDGEIVALDDVGRTSFELLQGHGTKAAPIAFYAFDLLHRNGEDLLHRPLRERRAALEEVMRNAEEPLRFSSEIRGDPRRLLEEVCRRGLEGVIGKRADSVYEPGIRSRCWIKLKCLGQQEFVIGHQHVDSRIKFLAPFPGEVGVARATGCRAVDVTFRARTKPLVGRMGAKISTGRGAASATISS